MGGGVLGKFYPPAPPGRCAESSGHELYHLVPIAAGYWRAATPRRYLSPEYTVDLESMPEVWPGLLRRWGFDPENETLTGLFPTRGANGKTAVNSRRSSKTTLVMKELLMMDSAFREGVGKFYAQDFACFGYEHGLEY